MKLLTVQDSFGGLVSRVRTLDLAGGDAVQVSPFFPGQCLDLAIASGGQVYIEDVTADARPPRRRVTRFHVRAVAISCRR